MGGTTKYAKDTKMGTQIIFKEESYKIVGACFEVYKDKRNGFLEAVYQECLSMEFTEQGIPFVEKTRIRLDYKGRELRQTYEPDFLCFPGYQLLESDGQAIGAIGELRTLSENRTRTIRKPNHFVQLAFFVVERED